MKKTSRILGVFSACAEVVPLRRKWCRRQAGILRVRGGSSITSAVHKAFKAYSPRARR